MTTFISTQATGVPDTVAATGAAAYAWLLILIPLAHNGEALHGIQQHEDKKKIF